MTTTLRPATSADLPFILANLRTLAEVENFGEVVTVTTERLGELLFSSAPHARCMIIEHAEFGPVGHAWFYFIVPTFTGLPSLYLEDFVIHAAHRGRGIGRAAMAELASLARQEGCATMDWTVVEGNNSAVHFYERLGAYRKKGGMSYRLEGHPFDALARDAAAPR